MMEKAEICPLCGTAEWQWKEDPNAYEAVPVVCPGCQRRDWANDELENKQPGQSITLVTHDRAEEIRNTPSRMPVRRRKH